jgi:hypothetical protein
MSASNESSSTKMASSSSSPLSTPNLALTTNLQYMSGYLFKRSHNNTFKKWNRRWFTLINSKLYYQKRSDFGNLNQMESDLRVCKVREVNDLDRRFTFEIVSPKCRHLLQASSQRECTQWVQTIDKAISDALNSANQNTSNNNVSLSSFNSSSNDHLDNDCDSNEMNFNMNEFIDSNELYHFYNNINKSSSFNNNANGNGNDLSVNSNGNLVNNVSFKSLKELELSQTSHVQNGGGASERKNQNESSKNILLTKVRGNQSCCDCGASQPTWVKLFHSIHF